MMGKVIDITVRQLIGSDCGILPISALFVLSYIEKMIELVKKLYKYQFNFNDNTLKLAADSFRKDFDPNDFFLE